MNGVRTGARLALAALSCAALGAALLPGSTAQAAGERVWETGRVEAVADGDTVWVDVAGDGSGKRYLVRLAGVQATEVKHTNMPGSRNWCHGVTAKKALARLVRGKKVQLRAVHRNSRAGARLLRHLYVKRAGRWVDVQRLMLERGLVMNESFQRETTGNLLYGKLAQQAAANGVGMWRPTVCGSGPSQEVPLRLWVHWDAEGPDESNLNDEYVVIENRSMTTPLSLAGWKLRDTTHATYRFPSTAVVQPDSFVRVRVGRGTNTATDFYWGLTNGLFQNPDTLPHSDTAILLDPQDDFRAWSNYPCRYACSEPLAGKVRFVDVVSKASGSPASYVNGESIVIDNPSNQDVRLSGYYVLINGWASATFSPNRVLRAGDRLVMRMGNGDSDASTMYLGQNDPRLSESGGVIEVRNWNGRRLVCTDYGNKHC